MLMPTIIAKLRNMPLGRSEEARLDFQIALELAKQQGKEYLKANVEQLLRELNTEK